jgi:hypothetical protein
MCAKSGVVGYRPPDEDMMTWKFPAVQNSALLLAGAAVAICIATPASAQRPRQPSSSNGPNVVYQQGNTRIYVSKRPFTDGGTEVLPGDRKFLDYAFPSEYGIGTFARLNNNRPIDRQPLNPPSDLGGEPTRFPLY